MNKYLISVDIEGITGVTSHEYSSEKGTNHQLGCRYMEQDVNAVVNGLRSFDPTCEILVRDAHGSRANNLTLANLADVSLMQGWEGKQNMFAGLEENTSGILCVGYHAGGDNLHALLSHTLSSKLRYVKINDKKVNEAEIFDLYARSLGVPIIFVSGDDQVIREAEQRMDSNIVKVSVKKSLSRTCAISQSLKKAHTNLQEGAKLAAEKLATGHFKIKAIPAKLTLELGFFDVGIRASYFAELMDTLSFDKGYLFNEENLSITLKESKVETLLAKLNLIIKLSYSF